MMSGTKNIAILRDGATNSKIALAVIFGILTIALEGSFHLPVKLPGHRAFSGALALLVFAEAFAPILLIGFAACVSAILVAQGHAAPTAMAVWTSSAIGIWLISRSKTERRILVFVAGGLLFGFMRYLSTVKGLHHTPELIRLSGHLGFGCLGGIVSYGVASILPSKKK